MNASHQRMTSENNSESAQEPSKIAEKLSEKDAKAANLKHIHKNGRHYVRCETCFSNPMVVKMFSMRAKVSAISQEWGTVYRKNIVSSHFESELHRKARKSSRLSSLTGIEKLQMIRLTPIGRALSVADAQLAEKVGSLFLHVYLGAKRLPLSANSFPSQLVVSQMSSSFSVDGWNANDISHDLQYLSPNAHRDFLECIVKSDRNSLASTMSNSLAISLRCDGSVDRSQIDMFFLMGKPISKDGEEHEIFLGAAEPKERGAVGVHKATLGENTTEEASLAQSISPCFFFCY